MRAATLNSKSAFPGRLTSKMQRGSSARRPVQAKAYARLPGAGPDG